MLTADDLDSLVGWTLTRAARATSQRFAAALKSFGLTPQQFGVLAQLDVAGPMTQAALARAVLVTPQSTDALLATLLDRRLVERTGTRRRGHPNPVRLTTAGGVLLSEAWPDVAATNDLSAHGLDPERTRQLNEGLLALLDD